MEVSINRSGHRAPRQGGFNLVELMITVAIIMGGLGIVVFHGGRAQTNSSTNDMVTAVATMTGKIHTFFAATGSYTTISVANVAGLNIVSPPMTYDGTNLHDAWGNTMTVVGNAAAAAASYVVTIGGATSPLDKESCASMATGMANGADAIYVGGGASAPTTTNGIVDGTNAYKTVGGTPNPTNLVTGCGATNPVVALQFH